jgi:hypothetical protein
MPIDSETAASSKRPRRKESELQQLASQHGSLFYEVQMLNLAAKKALGGGAGFEKNVAIEAFLLHFRNVRDFLFPAEKSWRDEARFDDVIAFDYCSQWLWTAEDWSECSANERARLNKLLAHISYSRASLDHNWPLQEMLETLRLKFSEFVTNLPQIRKHWFDRYGA